MHSGTVDLAGQSSAEALQAPPSGENTIMAAYAIVIEQRGSCFRAYVPDVPGCTATGNSLAEAEAAVRDAMRLLPPTGAVAPAPQPGYFWVQPQPVAAS